MKQHVVESAVKHYKPKLKGKMLNSTSEKICCTYEEEKKKQIYISKNTEILLEKYMIYKLIIFFFLTIKPELKIWDKNNMYMKKKKP